MLLRASLPVSSAGGGLWSTYFRVAFVPNMFFMEAYTVIVGVLVGCVACALWRALRRRQNGVEPAQDSR